VVKGELARTAPHANLLEIRNKLLDAFKEKVTSTTIVGLCKRSLTKAKEYRDMNDDMLLVDSELEDEVGDFDEDSDSY
jgi:hypothetical protein